MPIPAPAAPDDELDALLADSVGDADSDLDLDDLLAESVQLRDEEREVKAARERLRKRGVLASGRTPEEVAEDEARIREWELRHDWEAIAGVAFWEAHKCTNCGRKQTIFRQLMLKQTHRQYPDTLRWQQVDELPSDLPQENQVQKWEVGMCTHCAGHFGFDFQSVPTGEWQG